MAIENQFTVKGVLYAKPTKKVPNKKKPTEPDYEFNSIILELKYSSNGTTYTDLPEFQLGKGVNADEFSIGDLIDVRFALTGKKISDTWHKTELKATYLKFADLENGGKRPNSTTYTAPTVIKDKVFVAPDPDAEDEGLSDLPF